MTSARIKTYHDDIKMEDPKNTVTNNLKANNFQPKINKQITMRQTEQILISKLWEIIIETEIDNPSLPVFADLDKKFDKLINVDLAAAKITEERTRQQSKDKFWHDERELRPTASYFGSLVKAKDPVKHFVSKHASFTSASVMHGRTFEALACKKLALVPELKIEMDCATGLLINPKFYYIGASPDRLVQMDGKLAIVEIKCPFTPYDKKKKLKAMFREKDFYVALDQQGTPYLKQSHVYYAQVQGQLLVSNLQLALFVLFVPPNDLEYIKIQRDGDFIETMLHKLKNTYIEKIRPHLISRLISTSKLPD